MNSTYQAEPKRMKKLLLTAVLASALSACSDSNEPKGSLASNTDAPVLDALKAQGLTIHGPLDVPGGLDAFAASAGTQALAVYVMPDSGYALIGTLIDEAGNPVADEELRRIVSEPLEQGAWDSLEAAGWVGDGRPDAEHIVYVFTDANCPFCNQLWTSARPWVEAGMVQLRHGWGRLNGYGLIWVISAGDDKAFKRGHGFALQTPPLSCRDHRPCDMALLSVPVEPARC